MTDDRCECGEVATVEILNDDGSLFDAVCMGCFMDGLAEHGLRVRWEDEDNGVMADGPD